MDTGDGLQVLRNVIKSLKNYRTLIQLDTLNILQDLEVVKQLRDVCLPQLSKPQYFAYN